MIKLKVIIEFSIYNKDYKQPKNNNISIFHYSSYNENKNNPLFIKFKVNDILEIQSIFAYHDLKSYAYVIFNNKSYEIPIDILNFCTEKILKK